MLTHLHPALGQLPSSVQIALDLLTGFTLVYTFRFLYTAISRWRLIRSRSEKLPIGAPVIQLCDVPGPRPPSLLWGSEWEMYNAEPGQKYLEWYARFGRVFKFKGVLGVSSALYPQSSAFLICTYPRLLSSLWLTLLQCNLSWVTSIVMNSRSLTENASFS